MFNFKMAQILENTINLNTTFFFFVEEIKQTTLSRQTDSYTAWFQKDIKYEKWVLWTWRTIAVQFCGSLREI